MLRDKGTTVMGLPNSTTRILAARLIAALLAVAGSAWGQTQTMPVEVSEIIRAGKLSTPNFFSLALDANGNIFVGGSSSNNVLRFAPRGDRPSAGGDAPCLAEIFNPSLASKSGFQFAAPKGIAVASDGTVYVTGTGGNLPPPGDPAGVNDDVVAIFPDGTITELANRDRPKTADWNPSGIAIDEQGDEGVFVYATGPAGGGTVRMGPDGTADRIFRLGGLGVAVDTTGNAYVSVQVAMPDDGPNVVYQIPDAKHGICGEDGKECSPILSDGDLGCDGNAIHLKNPYALAVVGGILYATGQDSGTVVRLPLGDDNALGLPVCPQEIFADGDHGLALKTPRAVAADGAGNVYAAGQTSANVIWMRPDPLDKTTMLPQEIINRRLRDRCSPSRCGRLARQRLRLRQHHEQRVPHSNDYSRPRMRQRREGSRRIMRLHLGLLLLREL